MLLNWCFELVVLEKTVGSSLDCEEITPVNPKGNKSWIFIGRTVAETELPVLWPTDAKSWLIGIDPDTGTTLRQEERGTTEGEMVDWHHRLNGHEFEQALEMLKDRDARVLQSIRSQKSPARLWGNKFFKGIQDCDTSVENKNDMNLLMRRKKDTRHIWSVRKKEIKHKTTTSDSNSISNSLRIQSNLLRSKKVWSVLYRKFYQRY